MSLALVDRGARRTSQRGAPAATGGLAGSVVRLAILPVSLSSDASLGGDLATLLGDEPSIAVAAVAEVGGLKLDSLSRSAEDVLVLDGRGSRPAVLYRAIVKIRVAGWTRGIVLLLDPSDLSVVPVSSAVGATEFVLSTANSAEIETRLRREASQPGARGVAIPIAPIGAGIQLHWRTHQVSFEGTTISLTLRELQLLDVLMEYGREVITSHELARLAWGASKNAAGALATTYVSSLRKKLAWFGGRFGIQTVRGVGYRFVV